MTTTTLKQTIEARYKSKRAFILDFNEQAGFEPLDETTLSRQLSGRVALSNAWKCAYKFFFEKSSQMETIKQKHPSEMDEIELILYVIENSDIRSFLSLCEFDNNSGIYTIRPGMNISAALVEQIIKNTEAFKQPRAMD